MDTILLVGGNGLLGRGLQRVLQESFTVIVIDIDEGLFSISASSLKSLPLAAIVNLSVVAETQKRFLSVGSPSWTTNVLGIDHLRKVAEELDVPLVHFSTREVLGPVFTQEDVVQVDGVYRPLWLVSESHPQNPQHDYGQTKLISEWITQSWHKGYVIRIATPYTDEVPQIGGGLLPALVRNSLSGNSVSLTQAGRQFRDPVHTDDIAALIAALIDTQPNAQLFNCAHGEDNLISLVEIVRIINPDIGIESIDGGDLGFAFDTTRARDLVHWTPQVKVRDRIQSLVDSWLRTQQGIASP